jgi:ATP-dependent DNA helicase RecG
MSRKKIRLQRRPPETERTFYEQMVMRDNYQTLDRREILDLIRGGEDSDVEFKIRLSNPDRIAAEIVAFANSGGGSIMFGVSDTCRVEGLDNIDRVEEELRAICANDITPPAHPFFNKVAFDNGRRILILDVDDRRAPHMTRDHKHYIRVGAIKREADPDEIAEMYRRYGSESYERIPLFAASLDDIDDAGVWSYMRALFGDAFRLPDGYPTAMALQTLRLAVVAGNDYAPTVAGLALFGRGRDLERAFPRCHVQATRFSGDSTQDPIVERVTFTGNLASLCERTEGFLDRYVELGEQPGRLSGAAAHGPAQRRASYSRAAAMEAVANALTHRDFSSRDGVRIAVFDRRIEIANPAFTKRISRESVEYGVSVPNNPLLKNFFRNAAYGVTTYGGGVPMIRRESFRFTRRGPKISLLPNEFQLELPGA